MGPAPLRQASLRLHPPQNLLDQTAHPGQQQSAVTAEGGSGGQGLVSIQAAEAGEPKDGRDSASEPVARQLPARRKREGTGGQAGAQE